MKTLFAALALLSTFAIPALADEDPAYITPDSPVPGHSGVIYADLIKQAIPGFDLDAHADWAGPMPDGIRHVEGLDFGGEKPDAVKISYIDVGVVEAAGHETIWVLASLGGGGNLGAYTLLMVFDDSAAPRLIDEAEVDMDRFTDLSGSPIQISETDEAMIVDTNHFNAGESYNDAILLFLNKGKITMIGDVARYQVRACTLFRLEDLTVTATPKGKGMWPITTKVVRREAKFDECTDLEEPKDSDYRATTFEAVYTWDAKTGQYVTKSDTLPRLYKLDGEEN